MLIAVVDDVQAEKELSEVNLQLESLHERLDEADGLSSAQVPIATRSSVVVIVITVDFHLHTPISCSQYHFTVTSLTVAYYVVCGLSH